MINRSNTHHAGEYSKNLSAETRAGSAQVKRKRVPQIINALNMTSVRHQQCTGKMNGHRHPPAPPMTVWSRPLSIAP
ncbi:MAG: hypothetical protein NVS2B7_04830 [Herpetosiphon sp.]